MTMPSCWTSPFGNRKRGPTAPTSGLMACSISLSSQSAVTTSVSLFKKTRRSHSTAATARLSWRG